MERRKTQAVSTNCLESSNLLCYHLSEKQFGNICIHCVTIIHWTSKCKVNAIFPKSMTPIAQAQKLGSYDCNVQHLTRPENRPCSPLREQHMLVLRSCRMKSTDMRLPAILSLVLLVKQWSVCGWEETVLQVRISKANRWVSYSMKVKNRLLHVSSREVF